MKVLLGHNFYKSSAPSGEDYVYRNEVSLLEAAGHRVIRFEMHNDDIADGTIAQLSTLGKSIWSRRTEKALGELLDREQPAVAHFHNTFPLISPSAYRSCRTRGIPVVQTLHNYRLICPGALLMREQKPCETCVGHFPSAGIAHACYRNSRTATAAVAAMLTVHRRRGTFEQDVDRYIALTDFARELFIRGGLPAERIVVKPNCLADEPAPGRGNGGYALYVGRLTSEKGVQTLVQAWRGVELPLMIVGDGALRSGLERTCAESSSNVSFSGMRPRGEVLALMRDANVLIIPSECYEGFPMTVLEGLASGTPMVVSALGAMNEILQAPMNCLKFSPGDARSLRAKVQTLLGSVALQNSMRDNNRRLFESKFSTEHALRSLLDIYRSLGATDFDAAPLLVNPQADIATMQQTA